MRLIRVELENIAVAASLSASFEAGFTVVTGETGAGKSLLGDAMALAFGERVSPGDILRHGETRGCVRLTFSFDDDPPAAQRALRERLAQAGAALFDDEREIVIAREFSPTGSRIRLNGAPIAREAALALRPALLDLHGQHELTTLFDPVAQRQTLDALGDEAFAARKRELLDAVSVWRDQQAQLDELRAQQADARARRAAMEADLKTLQAAQLESADEDARARQALSRLNQGEKLSQLCARALETLRRDDDQAPDALSQLAVAARRLSEAAALDEALEPLSEQMQQHLESLKDLTGELSHYFDALELSPQALQTYVDRLDALEKIKRRFGPTLADAMAARDRMADVLASLEDADHALETLSQKVEEAYQKAFAIAKAVSKERHALAEALTRALSGEMEALALRGARFEVEIADTPLGPHGLDAVTLLFSANPGEPLRPLAKTASGGELSRFLLALKAITASSRGVCALVFDEIDAGVSGRTARAVAERLQRLATRMQVIAITHQPLVAACGERHLHVEKALTHVGGEARAVARIQDVSADPARRRVALMQLASGLEAGEDADDVVGQYIDRLMSASRHTPVSAS